MKAYEVIRCSCDGGHIGATFKQYFTQDQVKAENKLLEWVNSHNQREEELARRDWKDRCYEPDRVDDISGWCVWIYGCMIYMKEIEID